MYQQQNNYPGIGVPNRGFWGSEGHHPPQQGRFDNAEQELLVCENCYRKHNGRYGRVLLSLMPVPPSKKVKNGIRFRKDRRICRFDRCSLCNVPVGRFELDKEDPDFIMELSPDQVPCSYGQLAARCASTGPSYTQPPQPLPYAPLMGQSMAQPKFKQRFNIAISSFIASVTVVIVFAILSVGGDDDKYYGIGQKGSLFGGKAIQPTLSLLNGFSGVSGSDRWNLLLMAIAGLNFVLILGRATGCLGSSNSQDFPEPISFPAFDSNAVGDAPTQSLARVPLQQLQYRPNYDRPTTATFSSFNQMPMMPPQYGPFIPEPSSFFKSFSTQTGTAAKGEQPHRIGATEVVTNTKTTKESNSPVCDSYRHAKSSKPHRQEIANEDPSLMSSDSFVSYGPATLNMTKIAMEKASRLSLLGDNDGEGDKKRIGSQIFHQQLRKTLGENRATNLHGRGLEQQYRSQSRLPVLGKSRPELNGTLSSNNISQVKRKTRYLRQPSTSVLQRPDGRTPHYYLGRIVQKENKLKPT